MGRKKKKGFRHKEKVNEMCLLQVHGNPMKVMFYLPASNNSMKVIIISRERFSNKGKGATYLKGQGKVGIWKSMRK